MNMSIAVHITLYTSISISVTETMSVDKIGIKRERLRVKKVSQFNLTLRNTPFEINLNLNLTHQARSL